MLLPPVAAAFADPADPAEDAAPARAPDGGPAGATEGDAAGAIDGDAAEAPLTSDLGEARLAIGLHRVGWHYGVRFQRLLGETMGGRHAPSTFGPTVAEADVYWRFAAWDPTRMSLPEDAPERWRDTAVAGTVLALNRLVDETLERAPQLNAYRTVLDTVVNPNLAVRRDNDRILVEHLTGGRRERRLESTELTADPRPARAPEPSLGVGVDWTLRDEEDPPRTPLLGYGVWLAASDLGISNLRAEFSVVRPDWRLTARQEVYPRVFLYANLQNAERRLEPGRVALGALWSIPWGRGWSLRGERAEDLPVGSQDAGWTWLVSLRGEQHTPIPAVENLPLGEGGLCFPDLPDRDPNELAPLNPPSIQRPGSGGCDRRF